MDLLFTIRRGIRFEWEGGEYINTFSSEQQFPGQSQALWIDKHTMREAGWYQTEVCLNVWDHGKDKPEMPFTQKAFEAAVDDWISKNS